MTDKHHSISCELDTEGQKLALRLGILTETANIYTPFGVTLYYPLLAAAEVGGVGRHLADKHATTGSLVLQELLLQSCLLLPGRMIICERERGETTGKILSKSTCGLIRDSSHLAITT